MTLSRAEQSQGGFTSIKRTMQRDARWQEAHTNFNPCMGSKPELIFTANGFDENYSGVIGVGGIYELWSGERGKTDRTFRTDDQNAFVMQVIIDGLARQGKLDLARCEYDEHPPGFKLQDLPKDAGILIEWGQDGWAEFEGRSQLSDALKFCLFMLASSADVDATLSSNDGSPLLQPLSERDGCGPDFWPNGRINVHSWERWLREKEGGNA